MSAMNISLYIPYVFVNFDKQFIIDTFQEIGEVSEVDFVAKQDRSGKAYNAVYVHFKQWYTNDEAVAFYNDVLDETTQTKFYYDDKWFWIVLPNKAKKYNPAEPKTKIDLGEMKTLSQRYILASEPAHSTKLDLSNVTGKDKVYARNETSYADVLTMSEMPEMPKLERLQNIPITYDNWADECVSEEDYYDYDYETEIDKREAEMDDIENMLQEEDDQLITIDGRYVKAIEEENRAMMYVIAQLRAQLSMVDNLYVAHY